MVDVLYGQSGNYDANEDRAIFGSIWANEGVIWGMNVQTSGALNVTVSTGQAVCDDEAGQKYLINNPATSADITVSGTAGTYLIYAYVIDAATGGSVLGFGSASSVPAYAVQVGRAVVAANGTRTVDQTRTQAEMRTVTGRYASISPSGLQTIDGTHKFTGTVTFDTAPVLKNGFFTKDVSTPTQQRFNIFAWRYTDTPSAPQVVPNNSWQNIKYNCWNALNDYGSTTAWQTATWTPFSTTTNGRVKVPVSGWYHVDATCEFAANSTGTRHIMITRGATTGGASGLKTAVGRASNVPGASGSHGLHASVTFYCDAGDVIEIWVRQSSGGSLVLLDEDPFTPGTAGVVTDYFPNPNHVNVELVAAGGRSINA